MGFDEYINMEEIWTNLLKEVGFLLEIIVFVAGIGIGGANRILMKNLQRMLLAIMVRCCCCQTEIA